MSGLIKYRVHEVAKDFNMTSKEITQILTDYATTPKNHMQVLEDAELNDIFEYLTQHHQAASLEELYKVPDQPKAKPQAASAGPVGGFQDGQLVTAVGPQQPGNPRGPVGTVRLEFPRAEGLLHGKALL
jgi:translation initiation factor IF-2